MSDYNEAIGVPRTDIKTVATVSIWDRCSITVFKLKATVCLWTRMSYSNQKKWAIHQISTQAQVHICCCWQIYIYL